MNREFRYLGLRDRAEIKRLHNHGATVAVISDRIGAHTATIYREPSNGYERDADVWDYIRSEHLSRNPLYHCDFSRLGCVRLSYGGKSSTKTFWKSRSKGYPTSGLNTCWQSVGGNANTGESIYPVRPRSGGNFMEWY